MINKLAAILIYRATRIIDMIRFVLLAKKMIFYCPEPGSIAYKVNAYLCKNNVKHSFGGIAIINNSICGACEHCGKAIPELTKRP